MPMIPGGGGSGSGAVNINLKGAQDTEAAILAILDAETGDAWYCTENGDTYLWTGTEWDNIGAIVGPTGPSAYDVAVENGFSGTSQEWLSSLAGSDGAPGPSSLQETIPLTSTEITAKAAVLSGEVDASKPLSMILVGAGGSALHQVPGVDYDADQATDSIVWTGLGLESLAEAGDSIIVTYFERA